VVVVLTRGKFRSLSVSEAVYNKLREIAERRGFSTLADTVAYLVSLEELVVRRLESITTNAGNITSNTGNVTSSTGNPPVQTTTQGKTGSGGRRHVIVFSLEWAKQKGIDVGEYMARREKEGYLCNEASRKVYCIWRGDLEELVAELNSTGAKTGELERVLSGEKLKTARAAVEAGLPWYDSREKIWKAPL
jgi:hypothetical protein